MDQEEEKLEADSPEDMFIYTHPAARLHFEAVRFWRLRTAHPGFPECFLDLLAARIVNLVVVSWSVDIYNLQSTLWIW